MLETSLTQEEARKISVCVVDVSKLAGGGAVSGLVRAVPPSLQPHAWGARPPRPRVARRANVDSSDAEPQTPVPAAPIEETETA